jgi:glucosamine--fructose-6-phosphate aminotransferase (isomerizing)
VKGGAFTDIMCGIVAYIGNRNASEVLLEGLRRLEYRGYDSAGVAIRQDMDIEVQKEVGKVSDLERLVNMAEPTGCQGIGHTRWATHGGVTQKNAHPHSDQSNAVTLVHNGIIENYLELREGLQKKGVHFATETDTEVIAQTLAEIYDGDAVGSLVKLSSMLEGSYAMAILMRDNANSIYCIRKGSPLVLGLGKGESFCASDVPALLKYTNDFIYLDEGDIAELSSEGVKVWDSEGRSISRDVSKVDWDVSMVDKCGYPHFMFKEINEQGRVLRDTLKGRITDGGVDLSPELDIEPSLLERFRSVHIIACGSSYYASLVAERLFETVTDLDIRVDIASEYRYRSIKADESTLAVFVSQSGETADTLAAERLLKEKGATCVAVTNNSRSTLGREVHHILQLMAGPEIGVAATKTFMGQMAVLYLLALHLGKQRKTISGEMEKRIIEELSKLPYKIESLLMKHEEIKKLAETYADSRNFLFLGRGASFPIAMEGALKLKEISYIHAEAYAAGEMKHGPIALLDKEVPVVVVNPRDGLYEKTLSNIQEARARKAPVVSIITEGDTTACNSAEDWISIPETEDELSPFLTVVPLQLFAYYVARHRGCDIDQPRNLAKSVTVE